VICALKRAGKLEKSVQHRRVKYLNNRLEADQDVAHGVRDDQGLRGHAYDPKGAMFPA
jgi:hypothetical protein